jgi:hypothetical protein
MERKNNKSLSGVRRKFLGLLRLIRGHSLCIVNQFLEVEFASSAGSDRAASERESKNLGLRRRE